MDSRLVHCVQLGSSAASGITFSYNGHSMRRFTALLIIMPEFLSVDNSLAFFAFGFWRFLDSGAFVTPFASHFECFIMSTAFFFT